MIRWFKTVFLLSAVLVVLGVPGVLAAWQYAHTPVPHIFDEMISGLGLFEYRPEDVVPDDEEASDAGENHLSLIEMILWEASYGLNATKKPILHNLLNKAGDVVYCSQNVQGGNLKHLMVDSTEGAERLYFVLAWVSDTEYHCYTMRYHDLTSKVVGSEIEVYKTVMTEDDKGVWSSPKSYYGHAKINDPEVVSRGIDVTTWRNN